MERTIYKDLLKWKNDADRKPLLLEGVRQCGKTYILKKFGKCEYEDVAYFTFERKPKMNDIFRMDLDPQRIVDELGAMRKKKIEPGKTLIILDEIQLCGEALTSLKFFCEEAKEYHVMCAGSLLGVMMAKPHSHPVGKVDKIQMYPMSFTEFLAANSEDVMIEHVNKNYPQKDLSLPLTDKLTTYLDQYFLTGGMPAAVASWIKDKDVEKVDAILDGIIGDYEKDFSKYASEHLAKLTLIWESIPVQLAKDNKKFMFGHVKTGGRARELEDSLNWLVNAGLVYKVKKVDKPVIPLPMFVDNTTFKIYLADVGILRRMAEVPSDFVFSRDKEYSLYRGAAAENYVLTELIACNGKVPYYWRSANEAEVDFVAQVDRTVVPVEVKAGMNKSKSLTELIKKYDPKISVVTSSRESKTDAVIYIPLYIIWKFRDLITDAVGKKKE
jgi:predicted AAA+ superfamily ATPase